MINDRIVYKNNFVYFDVAKTINKYEDLSATCKTYFPYYVSRFNGFPSIFGIYTKNAYLDFIKDPWKRGKDLIYFFDRFDMFGDVQLLNILKNNLDVCCLLDCKNSEILHDNNVPFKIAYINRTDCNHIEVKNDILF